MKRGHSNVIAEKCQDWSEVDKFCTAGVARLPLRGGATVQTCKELPPLALHREDWEAIGRKMGWLQDNPLTDAAPELLAACKAAVECRSINSCRGLLMAAIAKAEDEQQ